MSLPEYSTISANINLIFLLTIVLEKECTSSGKAGLVVVPNRNVSVTDILGHIRLFNSFESMTY